MSRDGWTEFQDAADAAGLDAVDHGNGHWQALSPDKGVIVNFYPDRHKVYIDKPSHRKRSYVVHTMAQLADDMFSLAALPRETSPRPSLTAEDRDRLLEQVDRSGGCAAGHHGPWQLGFAKEAAMQYPEVWRMCSKCGRLESWGGWTWEPPR